MIRSPRPTYNVIVWDGALGHFAADRTANLLKRIQAALDGDGVFVGSESLGHEGDDHLQFFESLEDLRTLLAPWFKYINLRSMDDRLGRGLGLLRREAYWRCSNQEGRLNDGQWQSGIE